MDQRTRTDTQGSRQDDRVDTALIRYLEAYQGHATYLVATASSMNASSIIIATGKPVMALGGFSGNDQILTVQQLARLVANGTVHYFLIQSGGPGGRFGQQQRPNAVGDHARDGRTGQPV
jgi:4-amino-4-deoxy-L-arabinose transferase-like glycosyltransferase